MKMTKSNRAILIGVLIMMAFNICLPSVIPRDFPAVTLPAIIGVVLTLWAINHSRTERAASA
jgi:hypothetical protein